RMASDPRQPGPNTRISNWLGSVRWKRSDFATHYPMGLAGFPRGLLEQITDDDAVTVMRCRKTIGWNWVCRRPRTVRAPLTRKVIAANISKLLRSLNKPLLGRFPFFLGC